MKTETHEQCTVCFEVLDATDPTTITADILDQLQLLITKLNIKLIRNSPICDACLAKVKSACKFKTSYLDLQETFHDIKLEEDAYSEKPAVCEICKSIVSPSDTIPLFDPVTKINKLMLINHLSPELESKVNEDPQTCESCHKSMLNFCSITNLLSVFDQDIGDDSEMPSTTVKKEHLDIDSSLVSASSSKDISTIVKKEESPSEDEETEDKDCTEYEEFLTKNEELDLKMDCDEEQGDERIEKKNEQQKVKTSTFSDADHNTTISKSEIIKFETKLNSNMRRNKLNQKSYDIEILQCGVCEYKTKLQKYLKKHMLIHKRRNELEIFQCEICDFKTVQKRYIDRHLLNHGEPTEIFKCRICDFKTRYKHSLNQHSLIHKKPDEVDMFQCKMCDFKTLRKANLERHWLVHKKPAEIPTFSCTVCNFTTSTKSNLKRHLLVHKNPGETEMLQCEICTFKTIRKGNLKQHLVIHQKNRRK